MLKQHISEFLRHDTLAKSALKSAVVHALLRDPLVGPEEEREPLEFRTFSNHHDVVMMVTIENY